MGTLEKSPLEVATSICQFHRSSGEIAARLRTDALRCIHEEDWPSLAYIINIALDREGSTGIQPVFLYGVASSLRILLEPSNKDLKSYFVAFYECFGSEDKQLYQCYATNARHAWEQTQNAYPGCVIINHCFDLPGSPFVILSHREVAQSSRANTTCSGFWRNENGWVDLESATRFTVQDRLLLELPVSSGMDAQWVLFEEASSALF